MHTTHEQHVSEGGLLVSNLLHSRLYSCFGNFHVIGGTWASTIESSKQNRKNIVVRGWFQHKSKISKQLPIFWKNH